MIEPNPDAMDAGSVIIETVLDNPDPSDGGTVASHVNHGRFWEPGATFPSAFFWDAYVAPRTPGALVSDGYGPNRQFLWEAKSSEDGSQLIFQGSVFDGRNQPFFAAEGPAPDEWGHHAVSLASKPGLGNPYVFTYWNGIAVGVSLFGPAQRRSVPPTNHGEGNLYVMGGTTANTLGGRIAALRAWDRTNPFTAGDPNWAFIPERTFSFRDGATPADLLIEYTVGGLQIADLAPLGYSGGGGGPPRMHPGVLTSVSQDQPYLNIGPAPTWVRDPRSPYGKWGPVTNTNERKPSPGVAPTNALVFDSFERPHQTFAFQSSPSLGQTEAGSLGSRIWNTATLLRPAVASAFGILNGRAVSLERQPSLAWVDCETSEQDVRLTRFTGRGQIGTTGIAFRVINKINWWYAIFVGQPPGFPYLPQLRVGHYLNTVHNMVAAYPAPTVDWTTLRVLAVGSTITFQVAGLSGQWTTVGTVTSDVLKNATGAGLAGTRQPDESTSLWRGDNFTVCPIATGC